MKLQYALVLILVSTSATADVATRHFVGNDRGDPRFACEVQLAAIRFRAEPPTRENLVATVKTNYSHNGDSAPEVQVGFLKLSPDGAFSLYQGADASGNNTVRVATPSSDLGFEHTAQVNIRWLHGDHHHVNTCINLKPAR